MPNFLIEQRERWYAIVTYDIEADNEEHARALTETGTCLYIDHEVINRDCQKVIDIRETHIN